MVWLNECFYAIVFLWLWYIVLWHLYCRNTSDSWWHLHFGERKNKVLCALWWIMKFVSIWIKLLTQDLSRLQSAPFNILLDQHRTGPTRLLSHFIFFSFKEYYRELSHQDLFQVIKLFFLKSQVTFDKICCFREVFSKRQRSLRSVFSIISAFPSLA